MPLIVQPRRVVQIEVGLKPHKLKLACSGAIYNALTRHPDFQRKPKGARVNLGIIANEDLGLPHGGSRAETYQRGLEAGFGLCCGSDAPDLYCQDEQPAEEALILAMKPLSDDEGYQHILHVENTLLLGHQIDTSYTLGAGLTTIFPGRRLFLFEILG